QKSTNLSEVVSSRPSSAPKREPRQRNGIGGADARRERVNRSGWPPLRSLYIKSFCFTLYSFFATSPPLRFRQEAVDQNNARSTPACCTSQMSRLGLQGVCI